VIFATSALGMGFDAPYVTRIIHITPPATVESYLQEIWRAGRTGLLSRAILYYNNSAIANNEKHIQHEMKTYCQSQQICLRQQILQYLGFSKVTQEKCCSVCEDLSGKVFSDVNEDQKPTKKFRMLAITNRAILEEKNYCEVLNKNQVKSEMLSIPSIEVDVVNKMMEVIEYIETESDLLLTWHMGRRHIF
jgi:superfamily II DNA helicase RecQ